MFGTPGLSHGVRNQRTGDRPAEGEPVVRRVPRALWAHTSGYPILPLGAGSDMPETALSRVGRLVEGRDDLAGEQLQAVMPPIAVIPVVCRQDQCPERPDLFA